MRISWVEYFLGMAFLTAKRSTCLRRQVGAILVRDNKVIATGYNGAAKRLPHCEDVGCLRDINNIPSGERHEMCRGAHAEENCLIQCAFHGVKSNGGTIYCNTSPCSMCAKSMVNAGVVKVIYPEESHYPDKLAETFLTNIEVIPYRGWKYETRE